MRADAVHTGYFRAHRVSLLLVVGVLVTSTVLFHRGPAAWQRRYYQLRYVDEIVAATQRHTVNPYLVAAVIEAESDWDAGARSCAGAIGLMQLMPTTARDLARRGMVDQGRFSPERLDDPAVNIEYGTAYLRFLVERYHEIEPALAAYNAGLRHVDDWSTRGRDIRDTIEFPATRHFVIKVSRGKEAYEKLYPDAFDAPAGP